jgi:transposase
MIRSRIVHTIHELATQGKSIHFIATSLGIARNTVRKYLRGSPPPKPRPARPSKLDPFKDQVRRWISEDHLYNCDTMFSRLQAQGYTGRISILKDFVHPLRPPKAGHGPVLRYETKPGEQLQFDWGEVSYQHDGATRKLYAFTAVLSYSRMRFVVFVKRSDASTMIRCLMQACEYFGGLPRTMLTDRMKTVLLEMDGTLPKWHPLFAEFMAAIAVAPRVCKPYTPQTKGKIERSVGIVKHSFWPGVHFEDLDDLNQQALSWCTERNARVHRTTHQRPLDRWAEEQLRPLPEAFTWERFGSEERKVSWDGYISYDGVLYGLPSEPAVAGTLVQVREHQGNLKLYQHARLLVTYRKRPRSHEVVQHPEQFRTVLPAAAVRRSLEGVGHQVAAPQVVTRALDEYDRLCGMEVGG